MAGNYVAVRSMKKMYKGSGNSGDIINLRDFSGGVPWNNPQIFVSFYGYIPDTTKNSFYTRYEHLGDDRYKIICESAGFVYSSSYLVPDVLCNLADGGTTNLFSGSFYGITFNFSGNSGTPPNLGTAGQDTYINSTVINSVLSSTDPNPSTYIAYYKTSFFSENLQNGVVYVKNTQRTWSGIFQNIRIFPERNAVETGLPIQYVVVEGDY